MNTENKYTPGPWTCMEFGGEFPSIGISVGNDSAADKRATCKHWIANVPLVGPKGSANPGAPFDNWTGATANEQRASARLIAAAPELLDSLCAIVNHAEGEDPLSGRKVIAARRAIAKAKGQ